MSAAIREIASRREPLGGKMSFRALVFGLDTQSDRREVAWLAYNYVFAEAGLNWQWTRDQFHALLATSNEMDVLRTYIQAERPHWGWSDDIAKLVRAAERRQSSLCRDLLSNGACRDMPVATVIAAAVDQDIAVSGLSTTPDLAGEWMSSRITIARDHAEALRIIGVLPSMVVAIEASVEAADATRQRGLAAIHKDEIDWTGEPGTVLQHIAELHDRLTGPVRRFHAPSSRSTAEEAATCSSVTF